MPDQNQNNFAMLVTLFLSEVIRSRRTSIRRAAEISSRVVEKISVIQTEEEALHFVTDLEREFEEVQYLKQALHFGYSESEIGVYEHEIKEYAAQLFQEDMAQSASFLQDAAKPDMTIQQLCLKYPVFCSYVLTNSEKGRLIEQLQTVPNVA